MALCHLQSIFAYVFLLLFTIAPWGNNFCPHFIDEVKYLVQGYTLLCLELGLLNLKHIFFQLHADAEIA